MRANVIGAREGRKKSVNRKATDGVYCRCFFRLIVNVCLDNAANNQIGFDGWYGLLVLCFYRWHLAKSVRI